MTIARELADIIQSNGDVVISGGLEVNGTTTTINTTTFVVEDKNIELGGNATSNSQNDGAGISILLPDASPDEFATLTYVNSSDAWSFNRDLEITGSITTTANTEIGGVLSFGNNTTDGRYDIVVGSQTTSRGMLFAPYVTFGTRFSNWDSWLGTNTRTAIGTEDDGIELATNFTGAGASGLNLAFYGLNYYTWTSGELSGLSAGDTLTLGTPKFGITGGGDLQIGGTTVIDSSRNITAAAITSTGLISVNVVNDTYNFKAYGQDTDSWFGVYDDANNSANIILTRSDGATMFSVMGHTGATTIAGTISSGAITSSGDLALTGNDTEIRFTGGNNRILFSGYRALEGATDGGLLQVGEGYTTVQSYGDLNLTSGHAYQVNGTTVIDSSRNLTNIGNISSAGESHFYKTGTVGTQTIVAIIGSNSNRPTLQFSESTSTAIDAGMSLEYNGTGNVDANFMSINDINGASKFQFTSGGDFKIGSTTVIDSSRAISSGPVTVTQNSGQFIAQTSSDPTNYYAKFEANYDYGQAFRLAAKGAGSEYYIMTWGDADGLEFNGGANSIIKFSGDNLSNIGTISSGAITSSGPIKLSGSGNGQEVQVVKGQAGSFTTVTIELQFLGAGSYNYEVGVSGTNGCGIQFGGGYTNGVANFSHTGNPQVGNAWTVTSPSNNLVRLVSPSGVVGTHPTAYVKARFGYTDGFDEADISITFS